MPKIIILSGIPGSGKSTWARFHMTHNWNTAIVSRDCIRDNHFPRPYTYSKANEKKVTEIFNAELEKLIDKGWDIIIDNTHATEYWLDVILKKIIDLHEEGKNTSEYSVYIKFFDISLWRALYRVWRRKYKTGQVVPGYVVKSMYKTYKKINRLKYKIWTL